jgi:23S rRNA-/tRNA-specific pseudouridylate synthase|tara:strand:+ start:4080 stop:4922 length:843 start_codon:yes stop_codon:yes gene_type:complete
MSSDYPSPTLRPGPPSEDARAVERARAEACERDAARGERLDAVRALYVDDDVLVVDKPPQTYAHDLERVVARGDVVVDEETRDERASSREESVAGATTMHRLDRDTSGALVCGRNGVATTSLSNQFKASGVVRKRYVALCAVTDAFEEEEETREEYRVVTGHGRAKFGLFRLYRLEDVDRELPGSRKVKRCETTIIIERRRDDGALLAECRPVTGRTHQIRLHAASLGLPLVGDVRYGGPAVFPGVDARGALLHAETIVFKHPRTGVDVRVSAPRPPWAR